MVAGSLDGRVSARLSVKGGRKLQGSSVIWPEADRLAVRRIKLLDQATRGASELVCRFLLAKANFVVVVAVRLVCTKGQWKLAEVTTQGSLNAGLGTVIGMDVDEDGGLLVAPQKGPLLR